MTGLPNPLPECRRGGGLQSLRCAGIYAVKCSLFGIENDFLKPNKPNQYRKDA
jgi:hypothetical protein